MPNYKNIRDPRLDTVKKAVKQTELLLTQAKLKLASPEKKMNGLLADAFGVTADHWSKGTAMPIVSTVSNVCTKIATCMARSTILFEPRPPAAASQFAAYVVVNTKRDEVFLTKKFFGDYSMTERAAYLAHEYVHLCHWPSGHPGTSGESLAVLFARSPLGIPPEHSVNNAYCYQYFIEWFDEEFNSK